MSLHPSIHRSTSGTQDERWRYALQAALRMSGVVSIAASASDTQDERGSFEPTLRVALPIFIKTGFANSRLCRKTEKKLKKPTISTHFLELPQHQTLLDKRKPATLAAYF